MKLRPHCIVIIISFLALFAGCGQRADDSNLVENHLSGPELADYMKAVGELNVLGAKTSLSRQLEADQRRGGETETSVADKTWTMLTMFGAGAQEALSSCRGISPGMIAVPRITEKGKVVFELIRVETAVRTPYRISPTWESAHRS
jgi:hypothetical protein